MAHTLNMITLLYLHGMVYSQITLLGNIYAENVKNIIRYDTACVYNPTACLKKASVDMYYIACGECPPNEGKDISLANCSPSSLSKTPGVYKDGSCLFMGGGYCLVINFEMGICVPALTKWGRYHPSGLDVSCYNQCGLTEYIILKGEKHCICGR